MSVPGSSFSTLGLRLGRDFGLFGTGVTVHLNDRVSLLANYDFQVSPNQTSHAGSGGLQYVW